MASIAEVITRYQSAQKSHERSVARAGGFATHRGPASRSASPAAHSAAGNAVQTARFIADAREKLGPELTEKLLDVAFNAATFAAEAAELAGELTLDQSESPRPAREARARQPT